MGESPGKPPKHQKWRHNHNILNLCFRVFVGSFGCSYPLAKDYGKNLHFCFSLEVLNSKIKQSLLIAGRLNHMTFEGPFHPKFVCDSVNIKYGSSVSSPFCLLYFKRFFMWEIGWIDKTMGSLDARPPEESSFPGNFHSRAASVTQLRVNLLHASRNKEITEYWHPEFSCFTHV